jgi:carboxymethylenebutenolidase
MSLSQVLINSANKLGQLPVYVSSGEHKAAVIVLQEWWGINEQIKKLAHNWFGDNYIALVPDLYRGKVATDHETAGHYLADLDWNGAIQDIQASVDYLKSKGAIKIGITGFCMGGALSLASSVLVNGLNASAPFYGINFGLADPGKAKVPLQLHFGTKDPLKGFSDSEAQDKLEKILKENNCAYEFFRYEGADHAFVNEEHPEKYNKEYTKLAHKRTLEFFSKYLD